MPPGARKLRNGLVVRVRPVGEEPEQVRGPLEFGPLQRLIARDISLSNSRGPSAPDLTSLALQRFL